MLKKLVLLMIYMIFLTSMNFAKEIKNGITVHISPNKNGEIIRTETTYKDGKITTTTAKKIRKPSKALNNTYTNFKSSRPLMTGSSAKFVDNVINHKLYFFKPIIQKTFANDNNFKAMSNGYLMPFWAGIYANYQKINGLNVDPNSFAYTLSLVYVKKSKEAEKILLNLLKNDTENYSATILLGLLSIKNKNNFSYLEKAFKMNPLKTIYLINWQASQTRIADNNEVKWDFFDAYIKLLLTNLNIKYSELPASVRAYLYIGIKDKCYNFKTKNLLLKYQKLKIKELLDKIPRGSFAI